MAHYSEEETIEFEANLDNKEEAKLRTRLIDLQAKIKEANLPVFLLLCGVNGSGKNVTLGTLRDWMDQRLLDLRAYEQRDVQKETMEFRRYWRDLPSNGNTGLFVSSWYSDPLVSHAYGKIDDEQLEKRLDDCNKFEKMMANGNAIFCKIWFHKSKEEQESFLRGLDEDPYEKWRVMPDDWKNNSITDNFIKTTQKIIKYTDKDYAPWIQISEGDFSKRLNVAIDAFCDRVEKQIEEIQKRLKKEEKKEEKKEDKKDDKDKKPKKPSFVKKIDMDASLSKDEYKAYLPYMRARLNALVNEAKKRGKKIVLAFEGQDASGKGGVISRVASSIYVRDCDIFPISAPTSEEKNHHYLWRFWTRLAEQKVLTVFDRTWYGRVLVERIEHFATDEEWKRAYDEINDFERQLSDGNNIVVKFLLYISKEEQLERFRAREETEYKTWKIGEEDWRNRDKWDMYDDAFDDMLDKTNTKYAPWHVVPGNNKKYGRIKTMQLLCEHLEKVLDYDPKEELPLPIIEESSDKDKKSKDKDKDKEKDKKKKD